MELLFAYLSFAKCQINVYGIQTKKFNVNFKTISVFLFLFQIYISRDHFFKPVLS